MTPLSRDANGGDMLKRHPHTPEELEMERGVQMRLVVCCLTACLMGMVDRAIASPIVAGFTVHDYVTGITDPMMLSFDSAAVLYVGRQNTESLPDGR